MGGRLLLKTLFLTSPIGTTAVSVSMLSRTTLPLARIVQPLAIRGSVTRAGQLAGSSVSE